MEKWMEMIQHYNHINKYGADNNMKLEIQEPGHIIYTMSIEEKHLSSPNTCHGGVIAGLMDSVIGTAALSKAFEEDNLVSTVEFKINYLQPVNLGDVLIGEGKIDFKGKSTIVSSGRIYKQNSEAVVAIAIGTFNVYPLSKRQEVLPENN
jgi:uncharacterized protein (TIGR00369 family)